MDVYQMFIDVIKVVEGKAWVVTGLLSPEVSSLLIIIIIVVFVVFDVISVIIVVFFVIFIFISFV